MTKDIEKRGLNLPELLGIPKGIIFSDLDGVWFDEANNFASPPQEQLEILKKAQDAGYLLVLNSDTAPDTLGQFARELGFGPAVIGENGATIAIPELSLQEDISPLRAYFTQLREQLVLSLMQRDPKAAIVINDATPFVKSGAGIKGTSTKAYIINTARQCSMGIYTRGIAEDGSLYVDDTLTQQTLTTLQELVRATQESEQVSCFSYPNLGSCLVKEHKVAKWVGVKNFIDQFPPGIPFFMLGDRIYDTMEPIADRVITCAVGNADEGLKDVARRTGGIIAPDNLTIAAGANYIIERILGS